MQSKRHGTRKSAQDDAVDIRLWATAIHEAGHAVIPRMLGLSCGGAKIEGTAETGFSGVATTHPSAVTLEAWATCPRRRHRELDVIYRARTMACQAGEEAELAILGSCPPRAAEGDLYEIAGMLIALLETPPLQIFILEHRLRRFTRLMVKRHRVVIEHVARALTEHSELCGPRIDALVAEARSGN